jgi:hypothetical protein
LPFPPDSRVKFTQSAELAMQVDETVTIARASEHRKMRQRFI